MGSLLKEGFPRQCAQLGHWLPTAGARQHGCCLPNKKSTPPTAKAIHATPASKNALKAGRCRPRVSPRQMLAWSSQVKLFTASKLSSYRKTIPGKSLSFDGFHF